MIKICVKCRQGKSEDKFPKNRRMKDGVDSWCSDCHNAASVAYVKVKRKTDPNFNENYNKWTHNKKENDPIFRAKRSHNGRKHSLKMNFGITIEQYDNMLSAQNNGCYICGKTPEQNKKRLAVDHNHKTGKIRALLCESCNIGIGLLNENPKILRDAAIYLEKHNEL